MIPLLTYRFNLMATIGGKAELQKIAAFTAIERGISLKKKKLLHSI
jgi:hypothetical protein